jgi:hypothetical protein
MTTLSAYTIANNCCDVSDLNEGITEIKQYFRNCEKTNKKPIKSAYTRLAKLESKKNKLNNR